MASSNKNNSPRRRGAAIAVTSPNKLNVRAILPLMVIALIGLAISGLAFMEANRAEESRVERVLELRADWRAKVMEGDLKDAQEALTATAVYVASNHSLNRDDFGRFVSGTNNSRRPVAALVWAPRVTRAQRAAFETAQRQSGLDQFEILERAPGGMLVRAADREEYLPTVMEERFDAGQPTIGYDVNSVKDAAAQARDTGQVHATVPILTSLRSVAPTYVAFWPIYNGIEVPPTALERRANFRGVVMGAFRVITVLNEAIANTPASPETIEFYASAAAGDSLSQDSVRPIALYSPTSGKVVATPTAIPPVAVAYRTTRSFEITGVRWRLEFTFSPEAVAAERSIGPISILIAGILLTGFFTAFLARGSQRLVTIQEIVDERTRALTDTNRELALRERSLLEANSIYQGIFENSDVAIIDKDLSSLLSLVEELKAEGYTRIRPYIDGAARRSQELNLLYRINSMNAATRDLLGYGATETVERLSDADGESAPVWMLDIADAMFSGVPRLRKETEFIAADGKVISGLLSLLLPKSLDAARRVTLILIDLTEMKLAEAARQKAEEHSHVLQGQLLHAARLSDMGQLSSAIAHELNQPLAAISNFLQAGALFIDSSDAEAPQQLRDALQQGSAQAIRAGEIIRRLRSFVENSDTSKTEERLNAVIEEALSLGLIGRTQGGTTIRLELGTEVPTVLIDKVQIQQVVLNLVRNSIQAMQSSPARVLTISTTASGDLVQVNVSDTGPGLPPEVASRLFHPFVGSKTGGMGIGLSICKSIIDAHGGRLWAHSNPDGGVMFSFTLAKATTQDEPSSD